MPLYTTYKIINGEQLLTKASDKEKKIKHNRFQNFKISNKINFLEATATDKVKSIFSTDTTPIFDDIVIDVIIARHKMLYCVVGLNGRGLMAVHGYAKYINEYILIYLKKHFKDEYSLEIDFKPFEFTNENFSKDFWGNGVSTERVYISSEKMYIKISCPNFFSLIENNPDLEDYFTNGIIKMIQGHTIDLSYKTNGKKDTGPFKFDRSGIFQCEFFDLPYFNSFLKKLIDKDFFEGTV
jgi:hypothetical protein